MGSLSQVTTDVAEARAPESLSQAANRAEACVQG